MIKELRATIGSMRMTASAPPPDNAITTQSPTLSLIVPPAVATCDQDDFINVRFWKKSTWIAFKDTAKDSKQHVGATDFLTDKEGEKLSKLRIADMTRKVMQIFNEIYFHQLDPPTWTKRSEVASRFLINNLCVKFEEFRWCEGGEWKAEAFTIIHCPDWDRSRKTGKLSHAFSRLQGIFLLIFFAQGARPLIPKRKSEEIGRDTKRMTVK